MKRPREDAELFRARREALAKLTNRGCTCEHFAWGAAHMPANGHHPACPHVNRRCPICREFVAKHGCSVLVCMKFRRAIP